MATPTNIPNPYVGPQPFEQKDRDRFFGRERESNELLSLVIANRMSLLYAQSGAGKTSLLNAKLIPMLEERQFEVFPITRVRGLIPDSIPPEEVPNPFVYNALISWAEEQDDIEALANQTIAGYLNHRPHGTDSDGLPAPRIIIFDQFEELFTAYPDRWRDRKGFFNQVVEALKGGATLFRPADIKDPAALFSILQNKENPLSAYFYPLFSTDMQKTLDTLDVSKGIQQTHTAQLAYELNRLIRRQRLFSGDLTAEASIVAQTEVLLNNAGTEQGDQQQRTSNLNRLIRANNFANGEQIEALTFPSDIEELIQSRPRGESLQKLNRMLLEEAYPQLLPKTSFGDPLLRVLFVIREDFIAQLDPYVPDLPNQLRSRLRLMRLQQRAALEAVKKPLLGTERSFDEGVAERLVDELLKINVETEYGDVVSLKGEYVEPVQMQVVCENLWIDLPDDIKVITNSHVQKFGDVNEALAAFYESSIAATVAESGLDEGSLRRFFERTLLTPAGTRGTVYRGTQQTGDIPNQAIDILENRHIIRGEWRGGSRWYELTHDRFIEPILQSNKKWLGNNVGGQEMLQVLQQRADIWDDSGEKDLVLLDDFALERAERWLASPSGQALEVSPLIRAFVNESRKQIDARTIEKERKQNKNLRRLLYGIGLLLMLGAVTWAIAVYQYNAAQEQIEQAQRAIDEADDKVQQLEISQNIAINKLEEAERTTAMAIAARDSAQALMQSAEQSLSALNTQIASASDSLEDAQYQLERAYALKDSAEIETVEAKKQTSNAIREREVASTARNEAVRKLNQALALAIADMAQRQQRLGNDSLAALLAKQAYAFDTRGNNFFEGQVYEALRITLNGLSADSTTQLGGPETFFDHTGQVRQVAYSPDGKWLVSGGDSDFIRVRNLSTNKSQVIGSSRTNVRCLSFSPDSQLLAICRANDSMELWEFSDAGPADTPIGMGGPRAEKVAFSQNSDMVAIITQDGWLNTSSIENLKQGGLVSYFAQGSIFRTLAVSSNDAYLVAADRSGNLYVWENWTDQNSRSLIAEEPAEQEINTIAFSPDNTTLATGGDDYRLLIWGIGEDASLNLENELLGHLGPINDIVYSRNGKLLASASSDKSIHVRSTDDFTKRQRILQDHDFWVWSVDFNRNGQRIATASGDGTVRIWITESQELVDKICQFLPGGQLSTQEWETYIGNDFEINQYQKPCP